MLFVRGRSVIRWSVLALCLATGTRALPQSAFDSDGHAFDPIASSNGKPVVLIFVRTDCPISNRYAPEIQRLSAKYAGKVIFWLVYPSRSDTFALITTNLKDFGYKLHALRDPEYALVKKAHAQITPEAALFDGRGELVYHGRIDDWYEDFGRARSKPKTHDLDDALKATLAGHLVAPAETKAIGCYLSDLQ